MNWYRNGRVLSINLRLCSGGTKKYHRNFPVDIADPGQGTSCVKPTSAALYVIGHFGTVNNFE